MERRTQFGKEHQNARVTKPVNGDAKQKEYLDREMSGSAHDLKVKLDSNRTLDSITRTPLILVEVGGGPSIPLATRFEWQGE